jgi:hypothetical protein
VRQRHSVHALIAAFMNAVFARFGSFDPF